LSLGAGGWTVDICVAISALAFVFALRRRILVGETYNQGNGWIADMHLLKASIECFGQGQVARHDNYFEIGGGGGGGAGPAGLR